MSPSLPLAPPMNQGMTVLDKSKFSQPLQLLVAKLNPRYIGELGKQAQPSELLEMRGVARVVKLGTADRGVLFDPKITAESQLGTSTRQILKQADAQFEPYKLELGYSYWTTEEILRSILPSDLGDIPTGFTIVGHIAHINLRDQYLPYKNIIGEVVLDKNPAIRTVVNKLDSIHSVYRTFDMEVIASSETPPSFWVEQHESGCRFQFDFSKVYWNSRLHSEHERLVDLFEPGQAVCDPFAGVGPFAVPAGKKQVLVFANDLNPESYKALSHNIDLNRVDRFIKAHNQDGRAFIRGSLKELQLFRKNNPVVSPPAKKTSRSKPAARPEDILVPDHYSHYVMNLPDSAIEFLDAFRGLYHGRDDANTLALPKIHVHCFYKHPPHEKEPSLDQVYSSLAARVSRALGHELSPTKMSFHDVRKVAPTKEMYCISFELPREVAIASA